MNIKLLDKSIKNPQFQCAIIKDPHFKLGFQNRIRKNYTADLYSKVKQLITFMTDNKIRILLIPGDVFDESYDDKWKFKYYQKNSELLKLFRDAGIRIISIPGNHDYFNGYEDSAKVVELDFDNIETQVNDVEISTDGDVEINSTEIKSKLKSYEYTVYGKCVDEGLMLDVSFKSNHPKSIHDGISYNGVHIRGVKYYSDLAIVKDELKQINSEANNMPTMCMLHQNVTPSDVTNITDFTYGELAKSYPNINFWLLGHYHIGYPVTKINNSIFINPWNFIRVTRDYEVKLDKHIPEFVHIQISIDDDNVETYIKSHELKVKSFDEAFKEEYKSVIEALSSDSKATLDFDLDIDFEQDDIEIIKKVSQEYPDLNKPEVLRTVLKYMEQL